VQKKKKEQDDLCRNLQAIHEVTFEQVSAH